VVAAFLTGSCASRIAYSPAASTPVAVEATTVSAPFDRAWGAVVQTLFEKNIPIDTVEKESGLLKTGELLGEIGKDCDCGSYLGVPIGGYGTYGGDARYSYQFLVERKGDAQTTVTVRSRCHAKVESMKGELECRLEPKRETELRDAIVAKASSGG
jgi:hypothetical protein